MTKIFISHSSTDNDFARQLAQALTDVGIDVWIDLANIPAGMKWNNAIQQGLKECEAMIVILSPEAMASENVGDEWLYFHTRKKKIFTVLWKLTEDIHFQLEPIQYVNFHKTTFTDAFAKLCADLQRQRIAVNGAKGEMHEIHPNTSIHSPRKLITLSMDSILPPPFEWVEIPRGKVFLEDASRNNTPKGTSGGIFEINTFNISKYPITNAQYQIFIDSSEGYSNPVWWDFSEESKQWRSTHLQPDDPGFPINDHPRSNLSWFDAVAFGRWLTALITPEVGYSVFKLQVTLPTEQQWQLAAIGSTAWQYPWGNEFDLNKCNTELSKIGRTTPVTRYPEGKSRHGVMDMSGNVWEWCLNDWTTGSIDISRNVAKRVLRGGAWFYPYEDARAKKRWRNFPEANFDNLFGFRLVMNITMT